MKILINDLKRYDYIYIKKLQCKYINLRDTHLFKLIL